MTLLLCSCLSYGSDFDQLVKNFDIKAKVESTEQSEGESFVREQLNFDVALTHKKGITSDFYIRKVNFQKGITSQMSSRVYYVPHENPNYLKKTQTFQLYSNYEGEQVIDSVELGLTIKSGQKVISGIIQTPKKSFTVSSAPGPYQFVATDVESSLSVTSDMENLKRGDAIVLEISVSALSTSVALIPKLRMEEAEGVSFYYQNLTNEDKIDRGVSRSEIVQKVTAIIERAGKFSLRAKEIVYLDKDSGEINTSDFDEIELDVSGFYVPLKYRFAFYFFILMVFLFSYLSFYYRKIIKASILRFKASARNRRQLSRITRKKDARELLNYLYDLFHSRSLDTILPNISDIEQRKAIQSIIASLYSAHTINLDKEWKTLQGLELSIKRNMAHVYHNDISELNA